jgi:hypothetical protein
VDEQQRQAVAACAASFAPRGGDDRLARARRQAAFERFKQTSLRARLALRRSRVKLTEAVLAELNWWRAMATDHQRIETPIACLVTRAPERVWWSDASHTAMGGCCHITGLWWRFDLTAEIKSRLVKGNKVVAGDGTVHINLLELVAMVATAVAFSVQMRQLPTVPGSAVEQKGDNTSAVGWVNKGGAARDGRCAAAMRVLGAVQLASAWSFSATHVPGKFNVASDGISRWPWSCVQAELTRLYPETAWKECALGPLALSIISSLLQPSTPSVAWEAALYSELIAKRQSGCVGATA